VQRANLVDAANCILLYVAKHPDHIFQVLTCRFCILLLPPFITLPFIACLNVGWYPPTLATI
jgi:hypothetical protein